MLLLDTKGNKHPYDYSLTLQNQQHVLLAVDVAGVVLLAALVATLLLVRRHRRSAAQQQLLPVAADGCKPLGPGSRGAQECESDTATDRLEHMARKQSRR